MTYISITCPNEECEAEIEDIEAEVTDASTRHPYGSTTALEKLVEIEMVDSEIKCAECGYVLTGKEYDEVEDRLIETAQEEAYE
jgi:hypothetical protein